MADKNYDNSGVLFDNEKKASPGQPDFTGNGIFEGKPIWISGWKKVGKTGKRFMSLAFRKKEEAGQENQVPVKGEDDSFF